jgi:hypothetical protein
MLAKYRTLVPSQVSVYASFLPQAFNVDVSGESQYLDFVHDPANQNT